MGFCFIYTLLCVSIRGDRMKKCALHLQHKVGEWSFWGSSFLWQLSLQAMIISQVFSISQTDKFYLLSWSSTVLVQKCLPQALSWSFQWSLILAPGNGVPWRALKLDSKFNMKTMQGVEYMFNMFTVAHVVMGNATVFHTSWHFLRVNYSISMSL